MYLISRKDAKNAKKSYRFPWRALRLCEIKWTPFWNSYLFHGNGAGKRGQRPETVAPVSNWGMLTRSYSDNFSEGEIDARSASALGFGDAMTPMMLGGACHQQIAAATQIDGFLQGLVGFMLEPETPGRAQAQ